jgi:alkylation response protein AidB-like acyl-CoA dehydrogenase
MSEGPDYNAMSDEDFRTMVREFVVEHYPPELRFVIGQQPHEVMKGWNRTLAQRGWVAPGWPREHGGMGLNPAKRIIFNEVFDDHGCARFADNGVMMVGPLLIGFGTQAQRERFLPRILQGEEVWCQGYSEPGAGSDLASLRTEAVREGDGWVINGQKIWTSRADQSDWCHMLVRTDKEATKPQDGISYMLVPMRAPGVSIRPIKILSMQDDFCEVFLDNVQVPHDALVGQLNKGWSIVRALMGGERLFLGAAMLSSRALGMLRRLAHETGHWADPVFMERYARLAADLADHNSLYQAGLEKVRAGGELGLEGAMLKIHQTELCKRITTTALELAGPFAGVVGGNPAWESVDAAAHFLHSLQGTIYGGSSEVQRNILARQALHLP